MNELLKVGWHWYPSVVIGLSLWTGLYVRAILRGPAGAVSIYQQAAFHAGSLAALIALVSPLDELGDEYLFSAHMVQHLMLMFLSAPLWLIGTPGWMMDRIIPRPLAGAARWLTTPVFAFLTFAGVMLLWHIPSLYEAAQEDEAIHIFEHLTFFGAGLIGWWPAAGTKAAHLSIPNPPMRILYVFLLGIPCTALAAFLTFASAPLYPFYTAVPHLFGLNALQDQQLGGLLMWVPAHMVLFTAVAIIFLRWFANSERLSDQEFADVSL